MQLVTGDIVHSSGDPESIHGKGTEWTVSRHLPKLQRDKGFLWPITACRADFMSIMQQPGGVSVALPLTTD